MTTYSLCPLTYAFSLLSTHLMQAAGAFLGRSNAASLIQSGEKKQSGIQIWFINVHICNDLKQQQDGRNYHYRKQNCSENRDGHRERNTIPPKKNKTK